MPIPTEPIGSIPRPPALISAMGEFCAGRVTQERMNALYAEALKDTIRRFEETGSPVITDGEQTKPSFATYPLQGAGNLAPDGVVIPFKDGHTRQLPRLSSGPFAYQTHADSYLKAAAPANADSYQTGRDLRLGTQFDLSSGRHRGLSTRCIYQRPCCRSRRRYPQLPR